MTTPTPPLDPTKPMQTRDGEYTAKLVTNELTCLLPALWLLTSKYGDLTYCVTSREGRSGSQECGADIINSPEHLAHGNAHRRHPLGCPGCICLDRAPTITPWTAATMPWPCRVRDRVWAPNVWAEVINAGSYEVALGNGSEYTYQYLADNFDHVLPNGETGVCGVES